MKQLILGLAILLTASQVSGSTANATDSHLRYLNLIQMVADLGEQADPIIIQQMGVSEKEASALRRFMDHSYRSWEASTAEVSSRILCSQGQPDAAQGPAMQEIISDIRETFLYKQYTKIYVHFGKPIFNRLNTWLAELEGSSVQVSLAEVAQTCQKYAMN